MDKSSKKPKLLGAPSSSTSVEEEEGIDRISDLPDGIIHNILSSFYIFDVVELSLLSKRWNHIRKTMPYLNFDINLFGFERLKKPCNRVTVGKFKDFINWVLISQCPTASLVRFELSCVNMFDHATIFRWIRAATSRNVQEIVLGLRLTEPFQLPYCVATCESLQVLELDLSRAILKLPNHSGFHQLKSLCLVKVELSDEHLTSCLFSKCPLLEKLILEKCGLGTMTVLDIDSTSLVHVSIRNYSNKGAQSYKNCTIKMCCPKLKVLQFHAPMTKDIILKNLFSIEDVDIYFNAPDVGMLVYQMMKSVPCASALKLSMFCIQGLYKISCEVRNFPSTFYKLKSLKLEVGIDESWMQAMILLLKYCPYLEFFSLCCVENLDEDLKWDENWKLPDPSDNIICLESHLKLIELTGFSYEENEMELLRFFLKNARVLEKLRVVWANYAEVSKEASDVVLKYPRSSSSVIVTFY